MATNTGISNLVDQLIEAASYRQQCESDLQRSSDGYARHNQKALELADQELQAARKNLMTALGQT